jgi:NAD(P)-dependent dehydrogenase (short-subunit alcohol dehydrogenase family)
MRHPLFALFSERGCPQAQARNSQPGTSKFRKEHREFPRGTYFTVQKALPLLNDGASIILNGSAVWGKGYPAHSAYSATNAALRSFVRSWTTELKDRRIRANVISPGGVETPMFNGLAPTPEAATATRE